MNRTVLTRSAISMSCSTPEDGYTTDDSISKKHQRRAKSWNTRNNSSNVSGVLNLELYNSEHGSKFLNNHKKHVVVSNHCYKTSQIPKFHCEDCYCRRSPVYPKLTMKLRDQKWDRLKKPKCKLTQIYCPHGCRCNYDKIHSTASLESNPSPRNKMVSETMRTKASSPQRNTFRTTYETSNKPMAVLKQGYDKPLVKKMQPHDQELHQAPHLHEVLKSEVSKQGIVKPFQTVKKMQPHDQELCQAPHLHEASKFEVSKQGHIKPFQTVKKLQPREYEYEYHQEQQLHEALQSENSDDKNSTKINKHIRKKKHKLSPMQNSAYFSPSPTITTITENEEEGTMESINASNMNKATLFNPNVSTDENLKKLKTFRKENYFDCHSTGNLSETKSEHKCVHKFVLNDRLVPQALYADGFGTSRCTECDKPIKSEIVHSKKDNAIMKEKINYQTNILRKPPCCIDRQAKYKINISTNSDRIEIKVPISFDKYNDLFNTHFKIKNPVSANSLALRHQKGVV